jgi:hypothetical protein
METRQIIVEIDAEIGRLRQARALLGGRETGNGLITRRARKKRTMSVEGRARIAAAQRARWAKQKRAAK